MITVVIDNGAVEGVYPAKANTRTVDLDISLGGDCPWCQEALGVDDDYFHEECEAQFEAAKRSHQKDTIFVDDNGRINFWDHEVLWSLRRHANGEDRWYAHYKETYLFHCTNYEQPFVVLFPTDDQLAEAYAKYEMYKDAEKGSL